MSKRTHEQQKVRAREKRERDRLARRKKRSQVVVITMVVLLVLSLVGAALAGLVGGSDDGRPSIEDIEAELEELQAQQGPPEDIEPCPPAEDAPEPTGQEFDEAPALRLAADAEVTATLVTSCGDIVVELLPDAAPIAVGNLVALAQEGFYDGTTFHRTQWDFVIQGGDPSGDGTGGPGYELPDELQLPSTFEPFGDELVAYPRGTLAMANRGPNTAGSQFFIVQADPSYPFPPLYTVFGEVVEGMDVVDRIAAGEEQGSMALDPVVLLEIRIEGLDEAEVDEGDDEDADAADDDADADEDADEADDPDDDA